MNNRLTNYGSNKEIFITDNDETRQYGRKECAYHKLAEYEDLEEQGLLLKLPCKVGDEVYILKQHEIVKNYVVQIHISQAKEQTFFSCYGDKFSIEQFSKTVFKTQAEAEKALNKIKKR